MRTVGVLQVRSLLSIHHDDFENNSGHHNNHNDRNDHNELDGNFDCDFNRSNGIDDHCHCHNDKDKWTNNHNHHDCQGPRNIDHRH
jgi:hypothetical protein